VPDCAPQIEQAVGRVTGEQDAQHVLELGKVPVVFGVHAGVPVAGLSERQVCDIYAGKLTNWREVGGPDLAIVALVRPESEVDTEVIRENIGCLVDMQFPDAVKVMPKTPDMAKALAATAGAIGVTTMTVVEQSQGRVRPLALGGCSPTAQNVQNKTYALTRNSFLVMRTPPSSAVVAFMAFVRSPAGAKVIAANGAVPTQ
jgi:phosphate transport system substrate-binding protein